MMIYAASFAVVFLYRFSRPAGYASLYNPREGGFCCHRAQYTLPHQQLESLNVFAQGMLELNYTRSTFTGSHY
jgi:hypothetical protein